MVELLESQHGLFSSEMQLQTTLVMIVALKFVDFDTLDIFFKRKLLVYNEQIQDCIQEHGSCGARIQASAVNTGDRTRS